MRCHKLLLYPAMLYLIIIVSYQKNEPLPVDKTIDAALLLIDSLQECHSKIIF